MAEYVKQRNRFKEDFSARDAGRGSNAAAFDVGIFLYSDRSPEIIGYASTETIRRQKPDP